MTDEEERAHCQTVINRWSNESDVGYVQVDVEDLMRERAAARAPLEAKLARVEALFTEEEYGDASYAEVRREIRAALKGTP
jgi:hypothetical protein